MLVVTRKKDEKLIIGNEIEIQVLRIGRDNVRLGIKAPSHISIYRYEIYEAIKQENVNAVQSQIPDKSMMESEIWSLQRFFSTLALDIVTSIGQEQLFSH